jgi:hypothetical protein
VSEEMAAAATVLGSLPRKVLATGGRAPSVPLDRALALTGPDRVAVMVFSSYTGGD